MFANWLKFISSKLSQTNPKKMQHVILDTSIDSPITSNQSEILFACGCFWGAEKGFWKLPGVVTTAVGYAGGQKEEPTYKEVCAGNTGHAEVVRVVWDESAIHLSDLLKMFWECHDPTQGNRQGNDVGSQYRSAIYTYNLEQKELALASLTSYQKDLTNKGFGTITTEIKSDQKLYYAEQYHQQYLARPGSRPYCSAMPTEVPLGNFSGSKFKLNNEVWNHFDWGTSHCVLRSNNNPIQK